jgi:integrase
MLDCVNIPVRLLNDKRLTLNDVRVYATLLQCSNEKSGFYLSRKEIQESSGVQRVSRHTQNLSHFGYIRIEKKRNQNTYVIIQSTATVDSKQPMTLRGFAKDYFEYSAGVHSAKTKKTYETAFREFERIEGNKMLNTIGIRDIEHFLSTKKVEASEWTARKYYMSLSSAFTKAVQWGYLTENPFKKVSKPKAREVQPAYFTEDDFRLFLSVVADKDFRELCITGLLTGLRLGELLALKWSDINFTSKVIQVRNSETFTTKTKKNRTVPMNEELYRLLRGRKDNVKFECENIFYSADGKQLKEGTVSQKFKRYVRRTGLNDRLHFHSLRHSFASALVLSGVSLYAVSKLLGHSTSKTTEIYSHLSPQQLHGEVNRISKLFTIHEINNN